MLTDRQVLNAKFNDTGKGNKLSDGGGPYLEIAPTGSKFWRPAYRIANPKAGQEGQKDRLQRALHIPGAYPATTLADARAKRAEEGVAGHRG